MAFPKGLVHGFGPQMGFVPRFHFWQNRQEKSLWRYFRKKKGLSRLQKQGVKKKNRKISLFKKGLVRGFGQKMGFFPRFHRWQNREEKSLCRYSRKAERLSRLYNQGVKKKQGKSGLFSKGVSPWFCPKNEIFSTFLFFAK